MTRFIREGTRPHSAKVVEGLTGSGAGGGNANLAAPTPFLISERGGEVSHVWVAGGRIYDPYTRGINQASGWVENGTVPRVALATPPGGDGRRQAEGIGPFSTSNYYSLGSGSDVLDFAGDFSACFVLIPVGAAGENVFRNGPLTTGGYWLIKDAANWRHYQFDPVTKSVIGPGGAYLSAVVNVVCFGRAGTTIVLKSNLGAYVTGAVAAIVPGTTGPARIGDSGDGRASFSGTILEAWFSAATPSDALFTAIQTEVKGRLGITAW